MNKYQLWIEEHEWPIESDSIATLQMQLVFPELVRVKGTYVEPNGTEHEREWCVLGTNTIDPLAHKYIRGGEYII